MDNETLRQRIDRATDRAAKLVEARPSWKQNILARSSQPTLSVPRTPVNNQAGSAPAQPRKSS